MAEYEFFLASSLEKVFPNRRPEPMREDATVSTWPGCRAAVQLVHRAPSLGQGGPQQRFLLQVEGAPVPPELLDVALVPSDFPCWETSDGDEDYLSRDPGLFPDLLRPVAGGYILPLPRQYRSVWMSFALPPDTRPGSYRITVRALPETERVTDSGALWRDETGTAKPWEGSFVLRVGANRLEPQRLLHTEWFHTDCLASYYGVEPWSERHWAIVDQFIEQAAQRHGINMLLTPVFTPPLDTAVGTERPTVQLVDVCVNHGRYSFGFDKLARWTSICRRHGVTHLEIAHLFTQWGARATPKIMANVDGEMQHIFGWDVPAVSAAYRSFLEAFLPALRSELEALGYDREHVWFHISDEPSEEQLDSYLAAKRQVADLLEGCPVVDALSSFAFYQKGVVEHPVPACDHIQPFLDAKVPGLWVYYCCCQGKDTPNRFLAMPSARTRIMGVLLYVWQIQGFLHWGYNYYFNQFSRGLADPYAVNHCNFAFPSGDPFLVYPGPGGAPLPSIRAEVQSEAFTDLRALQTLETRIGRNAVLDLVHKNTGMERMTFQRYPRGAAYLLSLREAVFDALEQS